LKDLGFTRGEIIGHLQGGCLELYLEVQWGVQRIHINIHMDQHRYTHCTNNAVIHREQRGIFLLTQLETVFQMTWLNSHIFHSPHTCTNPFSSYIHFIYRVDEQGMSLEAVLYLHGYWRFSHSPYSPTERHLYHQP
jgi:hypothetical protein